MEETLETTEKKKYSRTVKITGGLWDAYEFYKKKHPSSKITLKQYVNVCKLFNKKLSHSIITKSIEFRGFSRLGTFGIRTYKRNVRFKDGKIDTRKNYVDWSKTKQMWSEIYPGLTSEELKLIPNKKLVIHLNEHTNGYVFGWNWDRSTCMIKNYSGYMFKPVKGGITEDGYYYGRRGLSSWVVDENRDNEYLVR